MQRTEVPYCMLSGLVLWIGSKSNYSHGMEKAAVNWKMKHEVLVLPNSATK